MSDDSRHPSSQRFADVLDEALAVHDQKQQDYGRVDDPFSNVRASEDFGIPDWIGCAVRMNDKVRRIQRAAQRYLEGVDEADLLANESLEDAFMDLLVYAGIGVVMLRERATEDDNVVELSPARDASYDPWQGVPPLPTDAFFKPLSPKNGQVIPMPGVRFHTGLDT